MMYFKKFFLIPMFTLLIFVGCGSDDTTGPDNGDMSIENYMPLAVGNSWTHRYIDDNSLVIPDHIDTGYSTRVIDESFSWRNYTVYKKHMVGSQGIFYWLYVNGETHTYYYEEPSDTGYYFIFLSEPLEVGNEWIVSTDPMSSNTARIENVNVGISVPAGIFNNCIRVKWPGDNAYDIYAPGVGLIKSYYEDATGSSTEELTEYIINN